MLVAGGQFETKNGQVDKCKTTATVAAARETSIRIGATALLFSLAFSQPGPPTEYLENPDRVSREPTLLGFV